MYVQKRSRDETRRLDAELESLAAQVKVLLETEDDEPLIDDDNNNMNEQYE